ncbi:hypothetical protein BOO29_18345 [Vibrio navarrensis]|nr:hypothetical protein [Vibrio navarrensis]
MIGTRLLGRARAEEKVLGVWALGKEKASKAGNEFARSEITRKSKGGKKGPMALGPGKSGRARAEERGLGSGSLVLGRARAEKEGTRLTGTRLLGRARAEEKDCFS